MFNSYYSSVSESFPKQPKAKTQVNMKQNGSSQNGGPSLFYSEKLAGRRAPAKMRACKGLWVVNKPVCTGIKWVDKCKKKQNISNLLNNSTSGVKLTPRRGIKFGGVKITPKSE